MYPADTAGARHQKIYLVPTFPAFLSETVVKTLVEAYDLHPTTTPEQNLDAILGRW